MISKSEPFAFSQTRKINWRVKKTYYSDYTCANRVWSDST